MRNGILFFATFILCFNTLSYSKEDIEDDKFNEATKAWVSTHVEFANASIDHRCQKLKNKIRKCEDILRHYECNPNQVDPTELKEIQNIWRKKIQHLENKIYNLKLLKSASELVDFKTFCK